MLYIPISYNIVYSFTEMVPILLRLNGAQYVYSERFCQNSLEIFFGKQRERGRRNDNPTADQFFHNSTAISIGKSLTTGGCSNIRKRKAELDVESLVLHYLNVFQKVDVYSNMILSCNQFLQATYCNI